MAARPFILAYTLPYTMKKYYRIAVEKYVCTHVKRVNFVAVGLFKYNIQSAACISVGDVHISSGGEDMLNTAISFKVHIARGNVGWSVLRYIMISLLKSLSKSVAPFLLFSFWQLYIA